jgi:hypothetical protein
MAVDPKLIKKADLARVREIEFTEMFGYSIKKLMEALGVTRKIAKQAGTVLKSYKATGTLEDGAVAEGETIPLSKYKTEPVNYQEITLKKWRKATSAEAITDRGYDQAVEMTTDEMLKDVQKGIRKDFFTFLATGTGTATGATFQATLAQAWGQLQVLFEDDEIGAVYFLNPLDVADYLATANITLQTAFGMTYVENFLGLGTVIFNSSVPKGKIYATAKDNIVVKHLDLFFRLVRFNYFTLRKEGRAAVPVRGQRPDLAFISCTPELLRTDVALLRTCHAVYSSRRKRNVQIHRICSFKPARADVSSFRRLEHYAANHCDIALLRVLEILVLLLRDVVDGYSVWGVHAKHLPL